MSVSTADLDASQRERLARVAANRPVNKTLAPGVHIVDEASFT